MHLFVQHLFKLMMEQRVMYHIHSPLFQSPLSFIQGLDFTWNIEFYTMIFEQVITEQVMESERYEWWKKNQRKYQTVKLDPIANYKIIRWR